MSDSKSKLFGRVVVVQPRLEPWPKKIWFFGPIAIGLYVRVSSIGVGLEWLSAGLAVQFGPIMLAVCHAPRFLAATEQSS